MIVSTREQRAAAAVAQADQQRAERVANLDRANEVSDALARLKDEIHADASWLVLIGVITGDLERPHADAARLGPLLASAGGIGTTKVRTLLARAGVRTPRRRLRELTHRQRDLLAAALIEQRRRLRSEVVERYARTPRHWTRMP
jgi:hypothetical protein